MVTIECWVHILKNFSKFYDTESDTKLKNVIHRKDEDDWKITSEYQTFYVNCKIIVSQIKIPEKKNPIQVLELVSLP